MTTTEAQKRSSARYHKTSLRTFNLRLNRNTEPDIIDHLERQPNISGYIKRLILEDMKRSE